MEAVIIDQGMSWQQGLPGSV